ncbi:MAG: tRNA 2-thiouridine(34) synthase MnmA [Thermoleophilia bacterium]|nr:tRNA 2-thiouridine(34) synthase MnmA [Thermoleophilia bacterium]
MDPFLEHLNNPRNAEELSGAHATGEAGSMDCGALIRLFVRFDEERIGKARFQAAGSGAAVATGSYLSSMIEGLSWREAAAVAPSRVEAGLASTTLPDVRDKLSTAAGIAIEALHAALEDALRNGNFPHAGQKDEDSVLVAMSGGVDSSVACLLEHRSGRRVIGVTMRLWSDPACAAPDSAGCCSPQAIRDARAVCHSQGLPHLTIDLREEFENVVVDDFVREYQAGRTPNPCTRCNGSFRFPELARLAEILGASRVATGHYARLARRGSTPLLLRGVDSAKDQSYVLWDIEQRLLKNLEFPLGGMTKQETRRLAREASLPTQAREESQEVCFIPDNDHRRFLGDRVGGLPGEGDIVDEAGNRLGVHSGFIGYTIGQRRGLGISAPEPLYVLDIDPESNTVIAGGRDRLAVSMIEIDEVNFFSSLDEAESYSVQLRYNSVPVKGQVSPAAEGRLRLILSEAVYGVAPGQSAVIYAGDTVAAGGVIRVSEK